MPDGSCMCQRIVDLVPTPATTQAGADASVADATGARAVEAAAEAGPEAREVVETLLPLTQPPPGATGNPSLLRAHSQFAPEPRRFGQHASASPSLAGSEGQLSVVCMQGGPASGAPSR